jgi:hypothetical protein
MPEGIFIGILVILFLSTLFLLDNLVIVLLLIGAGWIPFCAVAFLYCTTPWEYAERSCLVYTNNNDFIFVPFKDEDIYINLNEKFGKDFEKDEVIHILVPQEKVYCGIRPTIDKLRIYNEIKLKNEN